MSDDTHDTHDTDDPVDADPEHTVDERVRARSNARRDGLAVAHVPATLDSDGQPRRSTIDLDPRYQNASEIARGGMGRVLVATDTLLGRTVALKQALATDDDSLRRFARETRITARLEHPSIVPVYDAGTTRDGSPYYVMRKVSGQPLDQLVGEARTLDQRLGLVGHVLAAAQAVAHAHERGIVHRDLKPTNILVGILGETVVIDWGLAKVIGEAEDPASARLADADGDASPSAGDSLRTRIGTVFGTPGFMAPEQVRGERVDARGDVYALGATLYYLLARRPPHAAQTGDAMMSAAMAGPPTPVGELAPGVPRELAAIVDKALAFDDTERYPDGGAFADDLNRFLKGQLVASHTYSTRERVGRFVRRNRAAVAAVALALVALAALGTVSIRRVLVERDRADGSARLASLRQLEAEAAKVRAQERAEQLLLTQARTMVAADPTAAVGLLKQLASQRERWPVIWRHARGIAAAARAEGVAFELPGPAQPRALELSREGERLVAVGADGEVTLVELGQQSVRQLGKVPRGSRVHFAGKDHLVTASAQVLTIIEIASGIRREVRSPGAIEFHGATKQNVYWLDEAAKLWRIGVAGGDPVLEANGPFANFLISPDETRFATKADTGITVYALDARGGLVAPGALGPADPGHFAFEAMSTSLVATYGGKLARFFFDGRPPQWVTTKGTLMAPSASGHAVMVMSSYGLKRLTGNELVTVAAGTLDMLTGIQTSMHDIHLVHLNGEIHLFTAFGTATLALPVHGISRLVASPSSPFIVAATPGHLLVWDVRALVPPVQRLGEAMTIHGLDRSQFIYSSSFEWHWFDADAGTNVTLPETIPPLFFGVSGRADTALFTTHMGGPSDSYLVRRDGQVTVLHEAAPFGVILGDASLVLATRRGAIVAYDAVGRRLGTLRAGRGAVESLAYVERWLTASWTDGTLWRRNEVTRREETLAVRPSHSERFLILLIEPDGTVFYPEDDQLKQWNPDGTTTVLAKLGGEIRGLVPTRSAFIVTTADFATSIVDHTTGQLRPWLPAGRVNAFSASHDRDIASYISATGTVAIGDLLAGEHWPIGKHELLPRARNIAMSGDGRHIAVQEEIMNSLMITELELPESADATAAWLDALTNAVVPPGSTTVTWPR